MAGVNKENKKLIEATIDEVFNRMNKVSWIERQKALKEEAFKNTEKLLYSYEALKEHLANEDEYIDMAFHGKSKSITSYTKNSFTTQTDDEIMAARLDSYYRSKSDVEKIENALKAVRNKKGFPVIEMRYFTTDPDDTQGRDLTGYKVISDAFGSGIFMFFRIMQHKIQHFAVFGKCFQQRFRITGRIF